MEQRIVISENLQKDIAIAISECEHDLNVNCCPFAIWYYVLK